MGAILGDYFSAYVLLFFLISMRILGVFTVAPMFSGITIPMQIRFTLAGLMAAIILPMLKLPNVTGYMGSNLMILIACSREFFIGVAIGFIAALPLIAVQLAGEVYGVQMGFSIANVLDPMSGEHVSVMGQIKFLMALWFYIHWGGQLLLLVSLKKSFDILPLEPVVLDEAYMKYSLDAFSRLFVVGMGITIPISSALALADIGLGFVARTAPQLNVFILGFPIKIIIGFVLYAAVFPMVVDILHGYIEDSIRDIIRMIMTMR